MRIAIYVRKSKATDKGESIDNQISLCKQYSQIHFPDAVFTVFQDDGYSGSNIKRPAFQEMMIRLRKGDFDVLMCYRLDRVSRNVLDFATTLDTLTRCNVSFVSIRESFDTTTPMGKAMLQISCVFAELERATIAERIRDNLMELAKTGRWLGGTTPLGYTTHKLKYESSNQRLKNYTKLVLDPPAAEKVQLIFNKFLEFRSLSKLETYLMNHHIQTSNNKCFRPQTLKMILTNPVYCRTDAAIYSHFESEGALLADPIESYTGDYGLMVYNKTKDSSTMALNEISQWVIAKGEHPPLIDSSSWLQIQGILEDNKDKAIPNRKSSVALLGGLLVCKACGAPMKVMGQSILADGTLSYTYRCSKKVASRGKLCNNTNLLGHVLDAICLNELKSVTIDKEWLVNHLQQQWNQLDLDEPNYKKQLADLQSLMSKNEATLSRLIRLMSEEESTALATAYKKEIDLLTKEIESIDSELQHFKVKEEANLLQATHIDEIILNLVDFSATIDDFSIVEKQSLIRTLIKQITWDGREIVMYLYRNPSQKPTSSSPYIDSKITYEER